MTSSGRAALDQGQQLRVHAAVGARARRHLHSYTMLQSWHRGHHGECADLRASTNGQRVRLGIKDLTQPDNGGEITIEETLSTSWSTVALPLSLFANVDQRHLYLIEHTARTEARRPQNG